MLRLLCFIPFLIAVAAAAFEEKPVSDLVLQTVLVNGRAVAWNGRNFVIVFDASRGSSHHIFRAFLDRDGNVLDSRVIVPRVWESVTSIASDGERYLVRFDSGPGLLLDENGNPLRADVPPASWGARMAASDGSSYLVGGGGLQLLDRNGDPVGGAVAAPSPEQVRAVAAAGSGYAVVTGVLDGETEHFYVRTFFHGVFSERIEVDAIRFGSDVCLASSGSDWIVGFRQAYTVRVRVVRADRTISQPFEWPTPWDVLGRSEMSAIWNGRDYVVAFADPGGTSVARVSRDGTLLDGPRRLSADTGVVTWNGESYLLAGDKGAQRFTPALDAAAPPRPYADYATPQAGPHIASDGESMLVVWSDGAATLRAARIAPDGAHLDAGGIVVTTAYAGSSAVTFDGRDWLVAYMRSSNRVAFRRIGSDGQLSAETSMAAGTDPYASAADLRVAAAPNGEFAILWTMLPPGAVPIAGTIRGSIGGNAPFQIAPEGLHSQPDVAWNGNALRVAWIDVQAFETQPPGNPHTEYRPVSVTVGTLRPGPQISIDATYKAYAGLPRLVGDGVLWSQLGDEIVFRGGAGAISIRGVPFRDSRSDPLAAAVDDAGRILVVWSGLRATFLADGATPFATGIDGMSADVVATQHGFVVAYARVIDEPPYNAGSRVFIHSLDFPPRRRAAPH